MTTTDSQGIVFIEETDPISPLHTLINALQSGTSAAVRKVARGPLYAANTSERDAYLAEYGSSAASPLWVDVNGVLQRHNGTAWVSLVGDTGWVTPTLLNGWVAYGGSYRTVQYRRLNNVVYVRGMMKGGTVTPGTVIFNLPAGFRPSAYDVHEAWGNGGAIPFEVAPTGAVVIGDIPATTLRQSINITFPVDA